ncbi:MAG: hypothetical protein QOI11_3176, partial [Candidatus Eremiobacteraeota bacterium]|nr:hypothetical protein [Candidatus Eremiobacteraeota bacterium]
MRRDRGFSLIELTVAVGLIALFAATGAGLTLANRSLAVAAAASELDQLLDSAKTMARELGGGRLTFTADGDGTVATFAVTDPDGTLVPTTLPALHTHAHIAEQDALGDPAFALVLHADGRLGGIPNARSASATEVGCPASGRYHIRISAAGGSADRYLPCRTVLAAGGPLTYTVWPPATIAPTPVAQCAGPCSPPPLPNASSPALTCPLGTSAINDTCVPVSPPTPTSTPTPTPTPTVIVTATSTPEPTSLATPTTQPTPMAACDLVEDGTCYRRIAGPTMEMFDKSVAPGYTCDEYGNNCAWVNKVGRVIISAREPYGIKPPIAPTDPTHQLLFHLNGIAAMTSRCLSFELIRSLMPAPPNDPLSYPLGAGPSASNWIAGVQWAPGYGQPGIYAYRHIIGSSPILAAAVGQATSD